jgi:hypothetical protein
VHSRVTQSWWNGQWGSMGSQRLRIHVWDLPDGQQWAVEHETARTHDAYPCDSETQAHHTVGWLIEQEGGDWRRVDAEALGYRT